jgi:TIR domain
MSFDGDAFISYAHLDNVELIEGRKGWVANLHRALEVRLAQLLGKEPQIWRDPKLAGNDVLATALMERVRRVAALVAVISPRYIKSEWTRKELSEFFQAAEGQGGVRIGDKARIFKVLKTPVPVEAHPPELRSLLGYEFFKVDPETGRVRELNEVFGSEAQRDFWIRLDDLAHDLCCVLEMVEEHDAGSATEAANKKCIYLAETTSDLREQRESIRRDLQQLGHTVLPAYPLPLDSSDLETGVRADMARCSLSIHMVGHKYSLVPEGALQSLIEIQNELAIERGASAHFYRLIWIPQTLGIEDERQRKVVDHLRTDPRMHSQSDLLESSIDDLRTVYHERLREPANQAVPATAVRYSPSVQRLYLIYDRRDAEVVAPYANYLFEQHLEVIRPEFEGDEAELREYHEENLRICDSVLVFYGSANECWVRRKLREVQKSAGFGRTKPPASIGVILIPGQQANNDQQCLSPKNQFRTHEAVLISQLENFSPEQLRPFLAKLIG